MVDGINVEDRKVREVRLAMLASATFKPHSIFPEHFKPIEDVDDDGGELPEDAILDLEDVHWEQPGEFSAEDAARTFAAMAAAREQSVQDDGEEAEGWPEPPDMRGEWT